MNSIPEHLKGDGPCQKCGGDNIRWYINNPFWNTVVSRYKHTSLSLDDPGGIFCFTCFAIIADEVGFSVLAYEMVPQWGWTEK